MGTRTHIQKLNIPDFLNQLSHLTDGIVSDVGELRPNESLDEVLEFVAVYDAGPGAQIEQVKF